MKFWVATALATTALASPATAQSPDTTYIQAGSLIDRPDLGRIAPGLAADIIAVDGDPLADVRQLETSISS